MVNPVISAVRPSFHFLSPWSQLLVLLRGIFATSTPPTPSKKRAASVWLMLPLVDVEDGW